MAIEKIPLIITFILGYLSFSSAQAPNRTFSVGPCTWIIERQCPDNDIQFYIFTTKNPMDRQNIKIDSTLEKSNISISNFNPHHPTKIIIHGYNSDMFLGSLISIKNEYLQKGDYNVIFVDWSVLTPGPCYVSGVHNTRHVGACVAQLIERILDMGTDNIHIIGFSLGAQLSNYVATNLRDFKIPRITGLDPAMPLYITAGAADKLDTSDAEFVDVIHTNALVQGKLENCGHVDFYMNGGIMQPGCYAESNAFGCSHQRAPTYFMESIRSFKGFWGWACSSYLNYLLGLCPPTNFLVEAGENVRPTTKGMYLIQTNEAFPFAKGKWTDISAEISNTQPSLTQPLRRAQSPLLNAVDEWGKLDGNFNNKDHFPTPYSQDPYGPNWPYFNENGPQEITEDLKSEEDEVISYPHRRPPNSKFKSKPGRTRKRPAIGKWNNRPVYKSNPSTFSLPIYNNN